MPRNGPLRKGPYYRKPHKQVTISAGSMNSYSPSFTATLTFTGPVNLTNSVNKGMTGVLSFTGPTHLLNTIVTGLVAASLNFNGTFVKSTIKGIAGGLSFTGPTSLSNRISKGISGVISFTGPTTLTNSISKSLAPAVLTFSGMVRKLTNKSMSAGLLLVGNIGQQIIRTINLSAALSFTGNLTRSGIFVRTFSAALTFTGSTTKSIQTRLVANLSFSGFTTTRRQIGRVLTARLNPSATLTNIRWYTGTFKFISVGVIRAVSRAIANMITQKQGTQ